MYSSAPADWLVYNNVPFLAHAHKTWKTQRILFHSKTVKEKVKDKGRRDEYIDKKEEM